MSTDPDSQQEVSNLEASQQPDQDDKSIDKKSDDVADPPAQEKQSPDTPSECLAHILMKNTMASMWRS